MSLASGDGIILRREVQAVVVPHGTTMVLPKDAWVRIIQALGGSHTVEFQGCWLMIYESDADALGVEVCGPDFSQELTLEEQIWDRLRSCYDPEIPVNIVELGLVYALHLFPSDEGYDVQVSMTLTSPGCGMGPILVSEVKRKLALLKDVTAVEVNLLFDPPWEVGRMSEEARMTLGL